MKMKNKIKKTVTCEWMKTEPVEGTNCRANTEEEFVQIHTLIDILEFKANLLLQRTGIELSSRLMQEGSNPVDVWNDTQVFFMHDLAKAYGDLVAAQELNKALPLSQNENDDTKESMTLLLRLHCLMKIQQDIGLLLETEYFNSNHSQMVRSSIVKICKAFKRHAIKYTYSLPPNEIIVDSMLAPQDGNLYKSVVNRVFTSPKSFERYKNW